MQTPIWTFQTRHGRWAIARDAQGRWHPMLGDEALGPYPSPQSALDDLVGGHSHWPSSGVDPSTCGLPDDLSDWTPVAQKRH